MPWRRSSPPLSRAPCSAPAAGRAAGRRSSPSSSRSSRAPGRSKRPPNAAPRKRTANTRSSRNCCPTTPPSRANSWCGASARRTTRSTSSASTSSSPANSPTRAGSRPGSGKQKEEASKNVFPSVLKTASYEGELYASPFNTNTQLLWYRKDLVPKPPETWDEMIEMAEELPEAGQIQVQAERYEGYTVWVNALIESAGTSILKGPEEVELRTEADRRSAGSDRQARPLLGRLAGTPDLQRGHGPARLRGGQSGLHGQLHLRLRQRRGKRPRNPGTDGRGAVPEGQLEPGQTAARRLQPRGQRLLRATRKTPSKRPSACPAKRAS